VAVAQTVHKGEGEPAAPEVSVVVEARNSGLPPLMKDSIPIGGRIMHFHEVWRSLGATYWQLKTARRGLAWTFHTRPTLCSTPLFFKVSSMERQTIMNNHIQDMLEKGAIEPVLNTTTPGFYRLMFLKPKKSGELRPIIDLSLLNLNIACPTFKMETAQSIRQVLTQGQWVASLDMKDAYFHIPIRKSFRKYLRFAFMESVWQFKAVPFVLSVAPWAFTGMMALIGTICHQRSIQIHLYLDDWLVRANSREVLTKHVAFILVLMKRLGLVVNVEKLELVPTQNLTFLGYVYDLERGTVHPTPENIVKVTTKVTKMLTKKQGTAKE
jgi:hypothetical protein